MSGHISSVDTSLLLSLATAKTALDQPASGGQIALELQARTLSDARNVLRDGETISVQA